MFASPSMRGFFDPSIHSSMPDDVIEITAERHEHLLMGESQGKMIDFTPASGPELIDPPPPTYETQIAEERGWRDRQLLLTDPLVSRHRDEVEEGGLTSITAEQYAELQRYRRLLRDWPQGESFPLADHRPAVPLWLSEVIG
ncbi:phage tail assembly chaperone [Pseudomonas sp. Irchel 3E19]|uniref:phage tail assembly chaperone n=1 Tax=Pseudomonas sp. Irchel 3E19 TaxID=2008981 RepID=UPI000BA3BC52|nr:phage tail assembly chaperone [Pseudomonas sp. Irchel 3E19]